MDSAALLYYYAKKGYQVYPLFVRQGLIWEKTELYWLKRFVSFLKKEFSSDIAQSVFSMNFPLKELYGEHWSVTGKNGPQYHDPDETVFLPGRNIVLLTKAAIYGSLNEIHEIALGPLKGNPFPDSRNTFFRSMEKSLSSGLDWDLKIKTPFLTWSKEQVISKHSQLPWELTFSCLRPKDNKHCGTCNKCRERDEVLSAVMPGSVAHT